VTERADFPNATVSVAAARRFVAGALAAEPSGVRERAELIVSELATNAVRHARSGFSVGVEESAGAVRVEVTDAGVGEPRTRAPEPLEPSGRGLVIVGAMADDWGVTERRVGKTVWFSLRRNDLSAGAT
jgi:anti-sigma regulatory factor (Ser/Thr protein kinase)